MPDKRGRMKQSRSNLCVCNDPMSGRYLKNRPAGYARTRAAMRLENESCISRSGMVRPVHTLSEGRCIFCDWLLPEGYIYCECGSGKLVVDQVGNITRLRKARYDAQRWKHRAPRQA